MATDADPVKGKAVGRESELKRVDTRDEQFAFLLSDVQALHGGGDALRAVCIVARTTGERDAIRQHLQAQGIDLEVIEGDTVNDPTRTGVRLATMHRDKGLELERVVTASMVEGLGLVPLPAAIADTGDDAARESAETEERSLVYVAATRAKKELLVLSYLRGPESAIGREVNRRATQLARLRSGCFSSGSESD